MEKEYAERLQNGRRKSDESREDKKRRDKGLRDTKERQRHVTFSNYLSVCLSVCLSDWTKRCRGAKKINYQS